MWLPLLLVLPPVVLSTLSVQPTKVKGLLYGEMNFSVDLSEGGQVWWEPTIGYITPSHNSSYQGTHP